MSDTLSVGSVAGQLRTLGVEPAGVLLVHTSFRAVRPIEWGPRGLILALREALGEAGTLVMPSWSGDDDRPFDRRTSESSDGLGVVPRTFWRQSGVLRSDHVHAFAAVGPRAEEILRDPLPLPPHIPESPVGRVHELDGQILLLGVDHRSNTTLHLAELLHGAPYRSPRYCTVLHEGRPLRVDYGENDHCCERFALVDDWLRAEGVQAEGPVGHGHARLTRSHEVVGVVGRQLRDDPLLFLHESDEGCRDCDEARAGLGADQVNVVRKSVAYITWRGKILFFRADEAPDAGVELPGGTLHDGEAPEDGLLREVREETGLADFGPARLLGVVDFDPGRETREVHRRHFFHLPLRKEPPQTWSRVVEEGNGTFTFRFRWIDPSDLPADVYPGHGRFVERLRSWLERDVRDSP